MSNARKLADNLPSEGQIGNRNLIINGGMEVAQRATSSTSGGYVSLDRWYVNQSGGSTTFSKETNSNPSETNGLQKYARLNVSSSSDFTHIRQRIEDVTKVPAGTVTISFYAKGTAPAGGLYVYGEQNFGSGGSSSVDFTAVLLTSSLTSSWVRYTAQITVPSIDGKTIGAGSYFGVAIGQHSNTSTTAYDLNITGVQLEVGSQSTLFEHEPIAVTLNKCRRYYHKQGTTYGHVIAMQNSTSCYSNPTFPVEMRAAPTVDIDHANINLYVQGAKTTSADFAQNIHERSFQFHLQSSGAGAGDAGHIDAPSLFYTADAEL